MSAPCVVREFAERDVAPANALTNWFIINTPVHFGFDPASDTAFGEMWRNYRERFPWLAAEVDGAFAGYCKAGTWRERDAYRGTVETGIYVVDALRGRGVGRALYAELFRRLRAGGFHIAVAGITLPNDASVRLHEALGFKLVGVFHTVGRKFDAWHDVGFWEMPLD